MGTQQQAKLPRVGVIANGSPDALFEAVRQSFAQHGYVEGRNIVIEARFAQGHLDRVPEFVAELVGLNVDIIVSLGAVGPAAAQKANTKLPIVFVAVIDPVAVGFAYLPGHDAAASRALAELVFSSGEFCRRRNPPTG